MRKIIILIVCFLISSITRAQTWSAVGNGVDGRISSFAIYNGELYVGGQFINPAGTGFIGLMKWNGTAFDTLPGNYLFGDSRVEAMCVFNNELYLGGGFTTFNTTYPSVFDFIAKWNGSSFSSVGSGCDNVVSSMAIYNGNLYIGGNMHSAGGIVVNGIGKWDGNQWSSIANGISSNGSVYELEVYNNELYAAGGFYFSSLNTYNIARWNDIAWNDVGTGGIYGMVYSLGTYNNELFAGGLLHHAGGVPVNRIAKWNGTTWAGVGSGTGSSSNLFALKEYHTELYAGGEFSVMDGNSIKGIARYNGTSWDSVGSGVDSTNIPIDTLITPFDTIYIYPPHQISAFIEFNNCLYVGGTFNMIGGVAAHSVAEWCTPVGVEEFSAFNSITVFPNPTTDKLTITTKNNDLSEIILYDIASRKLLQQKFTNTVTLNTAQLAKGMYVYEVRNGNGEVRKGKVVKE